MNFIHFLVLFIFLLLKILILWERRVVGNAENLEILATFDPFQFERELKKFGQRSQSHFLVFFSTINACPKIEPSGIPSIGQANSPLLLLKKLERKSTILQV